MECFSKFFWDITLLRRHSTRRFVDTRLNYEIEKSHHLGKTEKKPSMGKTLIFSHMKEFQNCFFFILFLRSHKQKTISKIFYSEFVVISMK